MRSRFATARSSRRSTTHTAPSDRTYPFASAANGLHRPSAASIDALLNPIVRSGVKSELTPPTTAPGTSPRDSARQARSSATSDEEHAVSTAKLGPRKSNRYEMRLAAMLSALPEFVYASTSKRLRFCTSPYSDPD